MRKKKGERNSVRRKTMVPFSLWCFESFKTSETFSQRFHLLWALFSSRVYSFFPSLRRLPRCTVAQQLANFAQPIQTRRPVDPSQPNLLFIQSIFFSLFLYSSTIVLHSLWSSLPIFRSADTLLLTVSFSLFYLYSICVNIILFLYNYSADRSSNNQTLCTRWNLTFLYFSSSELIIHSSILNSTLMLYVISIHITYQSISFA